MELVFLAVLIGLMALALTSGFPVAFALPGSAILAIALAAASGYLLTGDPNAYFAEGGPVEWLSAGVTNFRSLYWEVERDTLIAVPLFVFMGIMLQRSKIAEDLLVSMAQLFGPVPGGLGVSVVFVGTLLAATTGIVGATVIAMGLISLPAMLRNNYSKPLACGTICASGTLGQIIPPSIVLIILADQLSSATDQASTARKAAYKLATGEFSMPSAFDVTSTSAGDMFMGAFLPGLVLVGLYMVYILVTAVIRPHTAPPVHYEGKYDRRFALGVALALIPPLTLIFAVLGSIVMGVATVNQAGAIGSIGAIIMAGYRLSAGRRGAFTPAVIALLSTIAIMVVLAFFHINVKNVRGTADAVGIVLAAIAVTGLLVGVLWSLWRIHRIEDTLRGVMVETAKTTSMVFIILMGAAMLTAAFRGFGGEELVKDFLTSLPGGFWTQFAVVMGVIFILGFFIDFIEIAVVVVPIVAPILLANPEANVTAVWLGVMVGINMQTSFLTPPFGFALFYLRGVAPPSVTTVHIYKGAVAFILLQLVGLVIAGLYPPLVNYLPDRIYLTSETAPPPINPRLQACLEEMVFADYDANGERLRAAVERARALDSSALPARQRKALEDSYAKVLATFDRVAEVREAEAALDAYVPEYRPLHREVRRIQSDLRDLDGERERLERSRTRLSRSEQADPAEIAEVQRELEALAEEQARLEASIPERWKEAEARYQKLARTLKAARGRYRSTVDSAYEQVAELGKLLAGADRLAALGPRLAALEALIAGEQPAAAMARIKEVEQALRAVEGTRRIKSRLAKARRALKGEVPDRAKAAKFLAQGRKRFAEEVAWRQAASAALGPGLAEFEAAIRHNIGLRLQPRLTTEQAKKIAICQSYHRDISLNF